MKRIGLKKRRGLHTIIGAVFFVLVMGSTIGYVTYSMDLVDNLAYHVDAQQDSNLNRESEEFIISDVNIDGGEFNLTVSNTGTIPINVTKMWAKNLTDSSWNQTSYPINQVVAPGGTFTDVGQNTGLVAMDSESYTLKLLTNRGNALETQVFSASNLPLEMTLVSTPVNPLSGLDVSLLFSVKNNLTNGAIIPLLTPQNVTSGTATVTKVSGPTPASYQGLKPGETAFFEWTYDVAGDEDDTATFTTSLLNGVPGNDVSDTVTIEIAPVAQSAVQSAIAGAFGEIFLDFRSFEWCDPDDSDCTSDSTAWAGVWEMEGDDQLLWRVELENQGNHDFCLEERTALIALPTKDDGGTGTQIAFYIRAPSTTSVEDPGVYTNFDECIIKQSGGDLMVYFGTEKVGLSGKAKVYNADGIQTIALIVFAAEDTDDNGYDTGDPLYAQTLPFLGSALCQKNFC